MATIGKHRDKWRAQVQRKGIRRSKVFPTKREARDWAARQEYEIANAAKVASKALLRDVFDRYAREVSPTKRGYLWEIGQLERMSADRIGGLAVGEIAPADMADWRDRRLHSVSPGTCLREMNLLGAVFSQCAREWGLISVNPMVGVRRPKAPPPRDRLPTDDEIDRLHLAAGTDLNTATGRAFHAFLFAGETAMRAGEIVGLTWSNVSLERRVAHLPITKNGTARDVPLTSRAVELLRALPDLDPVFGLSSGQLDALFRKIRSRAAVEGLRFHDSRAWALTRLARKVDVMTLAKISGHRDLRILLNTYYRETAEDIAARLD